MTIRARLAFGLTAIALVFLAPLLLALHSLQHVHESAELLQNREFAASLLLSRMRGGADEARQSELALIFVHNDTAQIGMQRQLRTLAAMADSLKQFGLTREADSINTAVGRVERAMPVEYELARGGKMEQADSISRGTVAPSLSAVDRVVLTAENSLSARTGQRVSDASAETITGRNAAIAALIVAALIALAVSILLSRAISKPVRALEEGMGAVADGNFRYALPISPERRDEFGRLAESFHSMAEQLAQLDKLKAEFISVASHELKTPINVVLGYLQLLEEQVYGPISPKQREIVQTLEAQTQSLARLVQQLLDVSRFEAGGGKIDPRPVELDGFLTDLEKTFHVLARQRGIDFHIVRTQPLPAQVQWDPDRMNEVLGNLLSNAFKFTDQGGSVGLTIAAEPESANRLRIDVRDTGAGIPEAQLDHIFEKFYQADNQGAAAHGGTGLGLAIAKQIVDAHGGTICASSVAGEGTTFTIVIPARAQRQSGAWRAPAEARR